MRLSRLLKNPLNRTSLLQGLPTNPAEQGNLFDKATPRHSRINRLKPPGPLAERRYKVREAFLAVEKQVVAPDALCLADHPASLGSIPRDRDQGFSTAC
jgi:hypothetical protein